MRMVLFNVCTLFFIMGAAFAADDAVVPAPPGLASIPQELQDEINALVLGRRPSRKEFPHFTKKIAYDFFCEHTFDGLTADWNADGTQILVVDGKKIRIFDVETGKRQKKAHFRIDEGVMPVISWNKHRPLILVQGGAKKINLLDANTLQPHIGKLGDVFNFGDYYVTDACWSPQGDRFFVVLHPRGVENEGRAYIFDAPDWEASAQSLATYQTKACWNNEGSLLVFGVGFGHFGRGMSVWNPTTGEIVAKHHDITGAISWGGDKIAAHRRGSWDINIFDASSFESGKLEYHSFFTLWAPYKYALSVNKDGSKLAIGLDSGSIVIRDVKRRDWDIGLIKNAEGRGVRGLRWSEDGTRLLSWDGEQIKVWNFNKNPDLFNNMFKDLSIELLAVLNEIERKLAAEEVPVLQARDILVIRRDRPELEKYIKPFVRVAPKAARKEI